MLIAAAACAAGGVVAAATIRNPAPGARPVGPRSEGQVSCALDAPCLAHTHAGAVAAKER